MRRVILIVLALLWMLTGPAMPAWATPASAAPPSDPPPLVVLTETGRSRAGVPVLTHHPDTEAVQAIANQGFGHTALHLYQLAQVYLAKQGGPAPEPAYLLLKPGSGGFPRTGFYLDGQDRRQTAFTEVSPGRGTPSYSRAVRTFVHELNHTMVKKLVAIPAAGSPSTQIHEIGVRTDAETAWIEGFAESFEVMFVDDPDADPATVAWRQDLAARAVAEQELNQYRRLLGVPFSSAAITRLRFRSWYPAAIEQLRYHAVKANAFARQPAIPDRLLQRRNLYGAYLIENILPGAPADPPKSAARMLESEGVVSALFYRWATDEGLRNAYQNDSFYAEFGLAKANVTPVENVYLKLFHVLAAAKPQTAAEVVRAYEREFPDESGLVEKVLNDILLNQPLPASPEIWLANPDFKVGAMVYDQFRQLSHLHTFDLNGASLVDLLGVPGMNRTLAEAILKRAPYADLEELQQVDGVTPALMARFREMAVRARGMADGNAAPLLISFTSWLFFILGLGGLAGGLLYYMAVRRAGWVRALLNGAAAALFALAPGWFLGAWAQTLPLLLPLLLFGLPAAVWAWWRRRSPRLGWQKLLGWSLAGLPAFLLLTLRF